MQQFTLTTNNKKRRLARRTCAILSPCDLSKSSYGFEQPGRYGDALRWAPPLVGLVRFEKGLVGMSKRRLLQAASIGWQVASPVGAELGYGERMDTEDAKPGRGQPPSPALGEIIRGRIRRRIGDRVHELDVAVDDASVVLRGRCATFYTKQLAQHAALGVLNHEQLDNQIVVTSN